VAVVEEVAVVGVEILFLALALTLIPIAILVGTVVVIRRKLGVSSGGGRASVRRGGGGSHTTGSTHYSHSHGEHHGYSSGEVYTEDNELAHKSNSGMEGQGADTSSSSSSTESPLQSFVDAAGVSFSEPSSSSSYDSSSSSSSYDSSSSYSSSYDSGSSSSSSDSSSSSSFSSD